GISESCTVINSAVSDMHELPFSFVAGAIKAGEFVEISPGRLRYDGDGIPPWHVPGSKWIMTVENVFYGYTFTVTSVEAFPVTNKSLLVPDFPSPLPPLPAFGGSSDLLLKPHPMASITFTNVTGCPEAVDLNTAPPGLPWGCHTKRTLTT